MAKRKTLQEEQFPFFLVISQHREDLHMSPPHLRFIAMFADRSFAHALAARTQQLCEEAGNELLVGVVELRLGLSELSGLFSPLGTASPKLTQAWQHYQEAWAVVHGGPPPRVGAPA